MDAMAVGEWLLANLKKRDFDSFPSIMDVHSRRGFACGCDDCLQEGMLRKEIDADHIRAWLGPGMADLRAIAEADGQADGVTEEWFRRRRGALVRDFHYSASEVDRLTIPQFVDALRTPGNDRLRTPDSGAAVVAIDLATDTPKPRMKWQDAAKRLECLRLQGEQFSSRERLAEQFGCSSSTIQKAINNTPSLHAWANASAPPMAQSFDGVLADKSSQNRELLPDDQIAIREYLERDDLDADTRAFFNSLTPTDQVEFLGLQADPDADHSTNDPVTNGKGRLHQRILKRRP